MDQSDRRVRSHVAGAAAIAAFFGVALLLLLFGESQTDQPSTEPEPEPFAGQQTLLVQVTLDRVRAASLLTAAEGDPDVAVMLSMPADMLLVDGPAYSPLLDVNLSLNRRLTARATANTLGIRVDGGWRFERKALAGMVDSVGGVRVDLAEPAEFLDTDLEPVLELPAGESLLNGTDASWYAIGVLEDEDPILGVQQRFEEVFIKTVSELPDDVDAISALLTSLGSLSDPLNGTTDLAERLVALRNDFLAGQIESITMDFRPSSLADPVVTRQELEGGPAAAVGAFRVADYPAVTPVLREAFGTAPRVAGVDGLPRVLVWNGSGEPLASEVALLELSDADFVPISAGEWSEVQPVSRLNGRGYNSNGESYSSLVAEALRLNDMEALGDTGTVSPVPPAPSPTASPATMPEPDARPLGDVDVVFGEDYEPCPPDDPDCLDVEP